MKMFRIKEEHIGLIDGLDYSDEGLWALIDSEKELICIGTRSECKESKAAYKGLSSVGFYDSNNADNGDDGDDCVDDQGGVYGENLDWNEDGSSNWDE